MVPFLGYGFDGDERETKLPKEGFCLARTFFDGGGDYKIVATEARGGTGETRIKIGHCGGPFRLFS